MDNYEKLGGVLVELFNETLGLSEDMWRKVFIKIFLSMICTY